MTGARAAEKKQMTGLKAPEEKQMKQLIIFATGNKGKIREIRDIITDPDTEVLSMKEAGVAADPDEIGRAHV